MLPSIAAIHERCRSKLVLVLALLLFFPACRKSSSPTGPDNSNAARDSALPPDGQTTKAHGGMPQGTSVKSQAPITAAAWLLQSVEMGWGSSGGGCSYKMTVEVMNETDSDVLIDELRFEFHRSDDARIVSGMGIVTGTRVLFTEGGQMLSLFSYGRSDDEAKKPSTIEEHPPESQRIPANAGIRIPEISSGKVLVSTAGREPTVLSLTILHKNTPVGEELLAVLPPWDGIRQDFKARAHTDGFRMTFYRRSDIPSPSRVIDQKLVDEIYRAAKRECDDACLERVTAEMWLTFVNAQGKLGYSVPQWGFHFWSTKGVIAVNPSIPGVVRKLEGSPPRPDPGLTPESLKEVRIDCPTAVLIAEAAGAQANRREGIFWLMADSVTGDPKARPLWLLPYAIDGSRIAVLADTGEVANLRSTEQPPHWALADTIWNKHDGVTHK